VLAELDPEGVGRRVATVLAAIMVAIAVWAQWGFAWMLRLCTRYLYSGRRAACRRAITALRTVPNPLATYHADRFLIRVASDEADTAAAIADLERLIADSRNPLGPAPTSAWLVDIWVNAGRYRAAVLAPRRYGWRSMQLRFPAEFSVSHVNRAEALHNLGRSDLALKLLARIRQRNTSPIGINGGMALESWILADLGRAREARAVFEHIDPRPLTPYYAAETHFTRALIELCSGDYERAFDVASAGVATVVRASSERNGLFLLGRIEALRGNLEQALALYERGRTHRYRGQSARGLLELAELYERHARTDAARAVYAQAINEDPESAAAVLCRTRLAAVESTPTPARGS